MEKETMKKILLLSLSVLLILTLTLGFTGCKKKKGEDTKSYTLDTTDFNSVAVFGESFSLTGLKLVEENGDVVEVTKDMIGAIDTSSAGAQSFTFTYNSQSFTVNYTVKFRVTYVVEGQETVQLVTDVSEIVVPETPTVPGKQFDGWSNQLPGVLTSNIRIDAIYKTLSSAREDAYTWTGSGAINLEGYVSAGKAVDLAVTDEAGNALISVASVDSANGKILYTLGADSTVIISISGEGVAIPKSWKVSKIDKPTLTLQDTDEAFTVLLGGNTASKRISSTASLKFKYVTSTNNGNVNAAASNGYVFIESNKLGVTELKVQVVNATNELEYITLTHYVVVIPDTFSIANDRTDYGIEDVWTIGGYNAGGLDKLAISIVGQDKIGEGFFENVSFVTTSAGVTVAGDGTISVSNLTDSPDVVSVQAVFGYRGAEIKSAPMQIRCVYNGINVYNYADLWSETQKANPRPIVLQNSIKDDFSTTNYTEMRSTYDITYYENMFGKGTPEFDKATKIKVLIQFKNDVYGNGYEINAHNATLGMLDATGKPKADALFQGPLNFVSMSESNSAISVKGQDNIVFGIYEGVTINNTVLKSCDLSAVGGSSDLAELEFAGTTVEVLGDNVTIEYSRLMNGRTVLRVFGDAVDAGKVINVNVNNTLIMGAREFLARIGTNAFVDGTDANASPSLPGDTGAEYNAKKNYNNDGFDKASYDAKFIKTFVTFKNVVFEDAGIFAIALDSHFSGPALHDGSGFVGGLLQGWKNLAKTSYGAKVTLKDDVRLYNWKPVSDLDSSTIIENNFPKDNSFSSIKLDVQTLIAHAAKLSSYQNLLYRYNGVDYVHAGIAFFCGGKNYSVVDIDITNNDFNHKFQNYEVALSDEALGQGYLEAASGSEPFYFFIYDKSGTFTYETQLNLKDKYSCLFKK